MNQDDIKKIVQDEISNAQSQAGFSVKLVPIHTHNGVDSPQIPFSNLSGTSPDIPKSIGTAKGDTIGFSASATPVAVPIGSNGKVATADSTKTAGWDWEALPSIPAVTDVQVFNADGTWTKPSNAKSVFVQAWGGGGGGGGAQFNATQGWGGAGAGGSYKEFFIDASVLTSTVSITIGTAGTKGIGATGTDPTAGGNTTFGSYVTAYGGGAGNTGVGGGAANIGGGGGGGGSAAAGTNGTTSTGGGGGAILGGTHAQPSTFGGGGGGNSGENGGASVYGGGGGGGGSGGGGGTNGGSSVYGGGGGGSSSGGISGGSSIYGGSGGNGGVDANALSGNIPGGGGGGATGVNASWNGGAGAAGRVTVTTFF